MTVFESFPGVRQATFTRKFNEISAQQTDYRYDKKNDGEGLQPGYPLLKKDTPLPLCFCRALAATGKGS